MYRWQFTKGDTGKPLTLEIFDRANGVVDISNASVRFSYWMNNQRWDKAVPVTNGPAGIATGYWSGPDSSNWQAGCFPCQIAVTFGTPIPPPPTGDVILQANNGLWYEVSSFELSPGDAIVDFGQTSTTAGTQAYAVIVNLTDGLKYKFRLYYDAVDEVVTGGYDETGPTSEAETPVIITDVSGRLYQLNFVTLDGVITHRLDPYVAPDEGEDEDEVVLGTTVRYFPDGGALGEITFHIPL